MRILYKITYLVLIGAVLALGSLLVASMIPIPGNIEVKIVQSGSMEPTIKTGALTIVKPLARYAVGDIIMFGKDTKTEVPTTHRIVADEVRSGVFYYTTKGDANEDPDPQAVAQSAVKGKVLFSIPYLGYLLDFAKKPLGFALLVGVPAVLVIYGEIEKIWREMRKIKLEKMKEEEPLGGKQYGTSQKEN